MAKQTLLEIHIMTPAQHKYLRAPHNLMEQTIRDYQNVSEEFGEITNTENGRTTEFTRIWVGNIASLPGCTLTLKEYYQTPGSLYTGKAELILKYAKGTNANEVKDIRRKIELGLEEKI